MKQMILLAVLALATGNLHAQGITVTPSIDLKKDGISVFLTYHHSDSRVPAKITWWCEAFGTVSPMIFTEYTWPAGQTHTCRFTHAALYRPHFLTVDAKGFGISSGHIVVKIQEPVEVSEPDAQHQDNPTN